MGAESTGTFSRPRTAALLPMNALSGRKEHLSGGSVAVCMMRSNTLIFLSIIVIQQ